MKNDYLKVQKRRVARVAASNFLSGFNTSKDEGILNFDTSKSIKNFDFSTGALTEGFGLAECLSQCKNVVSVWEYLRWNFDKNMRESYLMYSDKTGKVYYSRDNVNSFTHLENVFFTSMPYTVNYRLYGEDVVLMCSENDGMFVWNGTGSAYRIEDAPSITSLAMHFERMFVTVGGERNTVWFSDDLDPTNWSTEITEGGFIQIMDERGSLGKVVSFLNYIYIFRDYGISRITAYADQSEFSASNLYVSSGKIYPGSVIPCMDTVLFLADDGVYRFDGLSTTKILSGLCGIIDSSPNAKGLFFGGKYFLSLRLKNCADRGNNENNAVLIYDLKNGSYQILADVGVSAFGTYGETGYAVTYDGKVGMLKQCGQVFGKNTLKTWESGFKDFGTDEIKTIKEFLIDASANFTLHIETETSKKKFSVVPKNGLASMRVNISGRKINIRIETDEREIKLLRPVLKLTVN